MGLGSPPEKAECFSLSKTQSEEVFTKQNPDSGFLSFSVWMLRSRGGKQQLSEIDFKALQCHACVFTKEKD